MAVSTKRITDLPEKTEVSDEDLIAVGNAGTASLRKTKWSAFWGKILEKIRSDLIVNNKTTTAPGYSLDARVGKDLQDQLTEINTKLTWKSIDINLQTPSETWKEVSTGEIPELSTAKEAFLQKADGDSTSVCIKNLGYFYWGNGISDNYNLACKIRFSGNQIYFVNQRIGSETSAPVFTKLFYR